MLAAASDIAALLERQDVSVFSMVELLLDNSLSYRYTDLPYNIDSRGETWIGAGNLIRIGALKESAALAAHGAVVVLSGLEESAVATALREPYQDRPASIYLGGLLADGQFVEPLRVFHGFADNANPVVDKGVAHIIVTAETRMARWAVPNGALYSDAEQQRRHPGDRFFEFLGDASEKVTTLAWPAAGFFKQ